MEQRTKMFCQFLILLVVRGMLRLTSNLAVGGGQILCQWANGSVAKNGERENNSVRGKMDGGCTKKFSKQGYVCLVGVKRK